MKFWPTAFLVLIAHTSAFGATDYLRDVKPVLAENCYRCHGASQQKGGLRLDTAALAIKGGDNGPALTLVRRLSLDLMGLPPTIAEIGAFLNDRRPDAYERLVERLLDSPHYGERWGRHWLDVARYADSNGYSIVSPRSIWKYRDWVVAALNRDLPFDQFP